MTLSIVLALVIAGATFSLAAAIPSSDPDLYWHLASARWMVEHKALLTVDPFSHTAAGAPYAVGEWLGQLAWYAAYSIGAWQGIAALRAALVATAAFFATLAVLEVQPRPLAAIVPLLAALAISKTTWTDRPQLFTLALFTVFFYLLLRAHVGGKARPLLALPPLALLWANLHGGYALGLALLALFAIAAFASRRAHARTLAAIALAAALASLVSPASVGLFGAVGHAAGPPRFIEEELPLEVFSPAGAVFAALLLVAMASALVAGAAPHAVLWAIVLTPLVWLGMSAQRHLPIAALALAPYLGLVIPAALARVSTRLALGAPRALRARPTVASVLAASLVFASVGAVSTAPRVPDESPYPRDALASLETTSGNLLNEYAWGGYLIWNAPRHPVFIDGRTFIFLPGVFADYREAVDLGPRFQEVLDRHDVRVVLLRPARPLAVYLREAGWEVRSEERDRYVLLVRP